jgi:D-alanine-D-alanine ligase
MKHVLVMCGGRSVEHEISFQSASSILRHLDRSSARLSLLGIARDGSTLSPVELRNRIDPESLEGIELPQTRHWAIWIQELRDPALIVFPVLHGPFGEDGTVQGVLEILDVPYVGAAVGGSAVGMNKIHCKAILDHAGLPVLPARFCSVSRWRRDPDGFLAEVEARLVYPVFVKPANLGSSVGVSRCVSSTGLGEAIEWALTYDEWVLVERGIEAREIEVSVLGSFEARASVPGEIVPSDIFYSYEAKYLSGDSRLLIPAPLPEELADSIRGLALRVFSALQLEGMARIDFLLDKRTGEIWVNEPNTIPGFTQISMYPKLWEASGLSYTELLASLLDLAVERRARRSHLRVER